MYPELCTETINDVATMVVTNNAALCEVINKYGSCELKEQLTMEYSYFSEWRKSAPFLPDSMQDIPHRPRRISPEPLDEFLNDWRKNILGIN